MGVSDNCEYVDDVKPRSVRHLDALIIALPYNLSHPLYSIHYAFMVSEDPLYLHMNAPKRESKT